MKWSSSLLLLSMDVRSVAIMNRWHCHYFTVSLFSLNVPDTQNKNKDQVRFVCALLYRAPRDSVYWKNKKYKQYQGRERETHEAQVEKRKREISNHQEIQCPYCIRLATATSGLKREIGPRDVSEMEKLCGIVERTGRCKIFLWNPAQRALSTERIRNTM